MVPGTPVARLRRRRARRALDAPGAEGDAATATVGALVEAGVVRGAVVATVEEGEAAFASFGPDAAAPGPDTNVAVGPLSRVVTGIALAVLAEEGDLDLDDRLERFLPGLPREVRTLRLVDLATHHAGLARRLPRAAGRRPGLPRERDVLEALRHAEPRPGRFRESDVGYAALQAILARVSGLPYDELVAEEVLHPLGMADSEVTAADGLRTSARDLARLARAQLEPARTPLAVPLEAASRNRRPGGPDGDLLALGWRIRPRPGGAVHWHPGGTRSSGAVLVADRPGRRGVAVLTTDGRTPELDHAAFALVERIGTSARRPRKVAGKQRPTR